MTDVFALAKRLRSLGPEERVANETVAEILEHLGREIELLRHGPGAPGREVTVASAQHWQGIYVDGRLIAQGPRLIGDHAALRRLIAELGAQSAWLTLPRHWDQEHERFPERLEALRALMG